MKSSGIVAVSLGLLVSGCVSSGYGPDYYDAYPGSDGQSMYSSPYGHWHRQTYAGAYVVPGPEPIWWDQRVYRTRPYYGPRRGYYLYD